MANDSNDRWADLELRETDEEYIAFLQQLNAEVLGQYTPGESPVLFPPLQTQNGFPQATLMHEETHQELMLTTTFGQFTLLLKTLTKVGPFKTEFSMCLKNQWQAHEGAATYAGLTVIANRGREEFEQEVNRLPSRDRGRSPYLELFEFVSRFLPIVPCSGQSRLKAQAATVTALAQCSLNTDCFVRFADPQSLTVKALHQYLIENSPGSRFQKICRALGADQIQRLAVELEEFLNSGQENPSPGVFVKRRVAASIPQLSFVVEFEEIKAQHRTFCAAWSGKVLELTGEPLELTPRGAQPFEIPQRSGALDIKPMTLPHFARVLQRCVDDGYGLWAVVYMEDKGKLKLDVFPYRMDVARNPKPEEEAIRKFLDHGFLSGVYEPTGVVSLLRQFPSVPLAITFVKWSWFFWNEAVGKALVLQNCICVCLDMALSKESIEVITRFRNLSPGAEYFRINYDESQAVACIWNPQIPQVYALQYLAGSAGLTVFRDLAKRFNIHEMTGTITDIPHLPLLRLMSLPAFQLSDPEAGVPFFVFAKLLSDTKKNSV